MPDRSPSSPHIAAARIIAIRDAARALAIKTGGDPAECMFDLICAAILISHEARPMKLPAVMIADVASRAAVTVEAWFPEQLRAMRRGDA